MPAPGVDIIVLKKNADWHVSTMPDDGEPALFKRCSFKKPDGFKAHCTWALPCDKTTIFVKVYGKTDGRAGSENKSELPPPVDTTLFFGNIAVIALMGSDVNTACPAPLSAERLAKLFDMLIGGTETLGGAAADKADADEDAILGAKEEADDDDDTALLPRTREGYAKDGFVVEDESDADSSDSEDSEGDSDEPTSDDDDMQEGGDGDATDDDDDVIASELGIGPSVKDSRGVELSAEDYDSE